MTPGELKKAIKAKLSRAEVKDAFDLLDNHSHLLKIRQNDVGLLKANYYKAKKEFDQNLISSSTFDLKFSKTIIGIQSLLEEDIFEYHEGGSGRKRRFRLKRLIYGSQAVWSILILVATTLLSIFLLRNGWQERSSDEEINLVEKAEQYFRTIKDPTLAFTKKSEVIEQVIRLLDVESVIYLKGEHGNILDQYQLQDFLEELSLGQHQHAYIENIQGEKISVRYSKSD
jgi:hypothetical protein